MTRLAWLVVLGACSSPSASPDVDAAVDVAVDSALDKAGACASTFGPELTDAFGRLDGTILAVVPPAHPTCTMPNGTHLVLQVTMHGMAYRMVVNVKSRTTDTRVFIDELAAPLAGEPWSEGWHPGVQLDYATTLQASSSTFEPHMMADAVERLTKQLELGARVSVFATSSGGSSAHLVHRNKPNADGAIVIDPETSPTYLLVRFPDQSF